MSQFRRHLHHLHDRLHSRSPALGHLNNCVSCRLCQVGMMCRSEKWRELMDALSQVSCEDYRNVRFQTLLASCICRNSAAQHRLTCFESTHNQSEIAFDSIAEVCSLCMSTQQFHQAGIGFFCTCWHHNTVRYPKQVRRLIVKILAKLALVLCQHLKGHIQMCNASHLYE